MADADVQDDLSITYYYLPLAVLEQCQSGSNICSNQRKTIASRPFRSFFLF